MKANIARAARTLLETGTLARSACSREFLATLAPLLDSGIVTEDKSGAGRRLVVRNPGAFRDFLQHQFPNTPVPAGTSSRVAGVSRFRDTKAVASDLPESHQKGAKYQPSFRAAFLLTPQSRAGGRITGRSLGSDCHRPPVGKVPQIRSPG